MRSFSQGSRPSDETISEIAASQIAGSQITASQPPMIPMPPVTAPVLQPQMNMFTQSSFSRVILQQQSVVGGSVKTESFTTLQPLKSVIQTTVNGHHTGNNGMTTNNGSPESMLLALSRPPITTAVLSNGNGRSPGAATTTTTMQISPPTYLSQAKVTGGEIQLMGSNTGQVLASRVSFGVLQFEVFL